MGSPARGYSWPPFEPGNQAARKHGVWAADVEQEASEVVAELYDPAAVERFPAMAILGAQVWVRRRRALAHIEENGMVVDDVAHPLLAHVSRWERTLMDLSKRYGLDPRSSAELGALEAEAEQRSGDLEKVREAGRAVIDAHSSGAASDSGGITPGAVS